jgi:hypothetical protein
MTMRDLPPHRHLLVTLVPRDNLNEREFFFVLLFVVPHSRMFGRLDNNLKSRMPAANNSPVPSVMIRHHPEPYEIINRIIESEKICTAGALGRQSKRLAGSTH